MVIKLTMEMMMITQIVWKEYHQLNLEKNKTPHQLLLPPLQLHSSQLTLPRIRALTAKSKNQQILNLRWWKLHKLT
jgi:hypothetical protein